jgi:transposase
VKPVVLFQDECHLLWGDICGYVWGKKNERVEVPIVNEKERQTYLGAVNIATGQCLSQAYPKGNGEHTIQYLKYLMSQYNDKRIALIWDGAKYHSSAEVKDFLSVVNKGLEESDWKITCLRLHPTIRLRIQLKIFGYKLNNGLGSAIICVRPLLPLNIYLS